MLRPMILAGVLALLSAGAFLRLQPAAGSARRGGPPPARAWASACAGKPATPLGSLALAVVSRPEGDEAWVQATWQRGPAGEGPRVELVLPAGATLLEGEAWQALPEGVAGGTLSWRVRFPAACTSDLVARLHATLGGSPAARAAGGRLWECA